MVCEAGPRGKPQRPKRRLLLAGTGDLFRRKRRFFRVESSTCYACRMDPATPAEWIASGYEARREQRPNDARDCFRQALSLSSRSGDRLRDGKNIGAALKHYQLAVELYRKQDAPLTLAHTIRHVADILLDEGNLESAQRHYEEALTIYCANQETPPLDLANTLRGYGLFMEKSGKTEEAMTLWQQTLALYEQLGIEAGVAECTSHLAFLMGQ